LGRFTAGGSEKGGEGRTVGRAEKRDDEWEGRIRIYWLFGIDAPGFGKYV